VNTTTKETTSTTMVKLLEIDEWMALNDHHEKNNNNSDGTM